MLFAKIKFSRKFPNPQYAITQLMQSFEFNNRICQPEKSDVHRGEDENNAPFVL